MCLDLFLEEAKLTETSKDTTEPDVTQPEGVVVNGREDGQTVEDTLSKGLSQMTTSADTDVDTSKDKTESVTSVPCPQRARLPSSKKKKKFPHPILPEEEQKEGRKWSPDSQSPAAPQSPYSLPRLSCL